MSASGDYGVRIVESFAPPANWVPGQEVNKDVYAVNTGDVDAYVKETVSSVLTIVREEATTGLTAPDADCIELSAGERYAIEAGAYLAYAPAESTFVDDDGKVISGRKVIAMNPDFNDEDGYTSASATDFQPDAAGLYVFRRTIGVNDDTKDEKQLEEYTYDAYYYVPGEPAKEAIVDDPNTQTDESVAAQDAVPAKFYKISNLTVTPEKATFAGDRDDRDGMVTTPVSYGFWKEVTETAVPKLTYDADNNRLVATYSTGENSAEAKQKLTALAAAYEQAALNYETALEVYQAALRDQMGANYDSTAGTDKELADANAALQLEIAELLTAQKEEAAAKKAYDDEYANMLRLKAAMEAAEEEKNGAAAELGETGDGALNKDTIIGRYERARDALGEPTDANDAGTAWGDENKAKFERDQALSDYNDAKSARESVTDVARVAFIDYLKANYPDLLNNAQDDIKDAVTYDDIDDLNVPAGDAYTYYSKLVAEKFAKKTLDEKQAAYEAAQEARVDAQNTYNLAEKAKNDAEADLGTDASTTDPNTATGRYNNAVTAWRNSMNLLYGENKTPADTEDPQDGEYTNDSLYGTWQKKISDTQTQQNAVNAAQVNYNTALANSNVAAGNVKTAADNVAKAKQAKDDAWAAYDNADKADSSELKININLADVVTEGGVAGKWQLLPESLEDKYDNETTVEGQDHIKDSASFYYTSILGGGKTTSKLIDSVELDETVTQDMFKYFDFDLNIDLNSVQVNVDSEGNYTAETAQSELGKYAVLSEPANADSTITWSDTATIPDAPTQNTYTAHITGDSNTYTITELNVPKTINYVDYKYELDIDGVKYYTDSATPTNGSTVYKKYDAATGTLSTTDTVTLDGAATPNS